MNFVNGKDQGRRLILDLWWREAQRGASGQNQAAVRATRWDSRYTFVNIALPILVFGLGICGSVAKRVNGVSLISYADVLTIATVLLLGAAGLQAVGDYRAKSIKHCQTSDEFSAIAQQIESTGFVAVDDIVFQQIADRLERVKRNKTHVPDRDWKAARKKYDPEILAARDRLRAFADAHAASG